MASVTNALEAAGCVAAREEAEALVRAAHDESELQQLLARRLSGEPLAWVTGSVTFCGLELAIEPGVYVPRWQSEALALKAGQLLPPTGAAVDLCTGAGAIAAVMRSSRPDTRVIATELDPLAASCARRNGVVVYVGNLDGPLPAELASQVDVMTGVLPYVPTEALHLLPRDVRGFEPRRALDGGAGGVKVIDAVVRRSRRWVRDGGWLLLEAGGDQIATVSAMLAATGYRDIQVLEDGDSDPRGVCGQLVG